MKNLQYWKNRFDFMMIEKSKNSYIYLGSNDEFQMEHRPTEVFNHCNLKHIVAEILKLEKITVDNISLYYEFMSDKDIINHSSLIGYIFKNRFKLIMEYIPSFCYSLNKKMYGVSCINPNLIVTLPVIDPEYNAYLKLEYFGIKDTLKPIDEYIAEIKESQVYKEYLAKKA